MRKLFGIVLTSFYVTIPLLIVLTVIRLCLSPAFIRFEYSLPGFPADTFGFTPQERLEFANKTRQYLLGNIDDFALQELSTAQDVPLFNQREIDHLRDVKHLTTVALAFWFALVLGFFGMYYVARVHSKMNRFLIAIRNGCIVLLGLVIFIAIAIFLDFNALFTTFHQIFFTGDSWLFYMDDSLIRLFPLVFWTHLFITIAAASAAIAIAGIILVNNALKQRKKELK